MLGCWRLIIVSIYKIDRLHIHICWWYSCLYLRCYGTSDSTLLFYLLVAVIELLRYLPLYCDYGFFGSQGDFPLHIAVNIPLHSYYICFPLDVFDQLHVCIFYGQGGYIWVVIACLSVHHSSLFRCCQLCFPQIFCLTVHMALNGRICKHDCLTARLDSL